MPDFKKAVRDGLQAHATAAKAREEIDAVIKAASDQLKEETGNTVALEFTAGYRSASRNLGMEMLGLASLVLPADAVRFDSLSAKRADGGSEEICEVTFTPTGYPVTLSWDNKREDIYDRDSLEVTLERLLSHPTTGGKIRKLMDKSPPPKK